MERFHVPDNKTHDSVKLWRDINNMLIKFTSDTLGEDLILR